MVDTVTVDIPTFIRFLEWAKEDAKDDEAMHAMVEKLTKRVKDNSGKTLTMEDYSAVTASSILARLQPLFADDKAENKKIADTILQQLGGSKFTAMVGAKDFVYVKRGLQFKLPSNAAKNKANIVVIKLNDSDTYDITFHKLRGVNITNIPGKDGVDASQLRAVFIQLTGLDTHL